MDAITRIREALLADGLAVYEPGQHPDVCKAPYLVVRQGETTPTAGTNKTGYTLATVFLYVPLNQYDQLATIAAQAQGLLEPLQPQVRPTGNLGPDIIEPDYKAHSRGMEYMILKKLR